MQPTWYDLVLSQTYRQSDSIHWLPIITPSIHPCSDTPKFHIDHKPWNTHHHIVSQFMLHHFPLQNFHHHFPLQKFHQNPMFPVKIPLKPAVSSHSISAICGLRVPGKTWSAPLPLPARREHGTAPSLADATRRKWAQWLGMHDTKTGPLFFQCVLLCFMWFLKRCGFDSN